MNVEIDWQRLWRGVGVHVAEHVNAGRGHLLTEDFLRFQTVLALEKQGVPPGRVTFEHLAPELTGGKVDLVIDAPDVTAAVEFKFPRDSRTGISPDTMTLGELLRDFYRLAGLGMERWVVLLLGDRLLAYLDRVADRLPLRWASMPGDELRLTPSAASALPNTARGPISAWSDTVTVVARCEFANRVGSMRLLAYRLLDRAPSEQVETLAAPPTLPDVEAARPSHPTGHIPADARGARREILEAVHDLLRRSGSNTFRLDEVLTEMRRRGSTSTYSEATIRTHVTGRMCANAPKHHANKTDDFTWVDRGVYRLNE